MTDEKKQLCDDLELLKYFRHDDYFQGSIGISKIQRKFRFGYSRASNLIAFAFESGVLIKSTESPYFYRFQLH